MGRDRGTLCQWKKKDNEVGGNGYEYSHRVISKVSYQILGEMRVNHCKPTKGLEASQQRREKNEKMELSVLSARSVHPVG